MSVEHRWLMKLPFLDRQGETDRLKAALCGEAPVLVVVYSCWSFERGVLKCPPADGESRGSGKFLRSPTALFRGIRSEHGPSVEQEVLS